MKYWALPLLFIFAPLTAFGQDASYIDSLVRNAADQKLSEQRAWKALLHYVKSYSGNYKSRIDDEKFFLSPEGRLNPAAELETTLRSFFVAGAKDGENSSCRFPARYAWLAEQLKIDKSKLPEAACTVRDQSLSAVEAKSAVLVFPVGHINSPASMFGHTLIRIDGSSKSALTSSAVNYSAENTDTNGFAYAFKGLTGLYKGYFSIMPYYDKVKEYSDIEHRDMWEYRLDLREAEVRRMLEHVWELHNISSSYYFMDENCSYNLLFLIEVARPELVLTDKTGILVVPHDTVKIVMESGIVNDIKYRPSQGTKIRQVTALLDDDLQQTAYDISHERVEPESVKQLSVENSEKIKILDLAARYVQFRYSRKEIDKSRYSRLYLKILSVRSVFGSAPEDLYLLETPPPPDGGHGTTRISVATGVRRNKVFGELSIRPQFHALLDPDQGFLQGAQIKFLDTSLRYGAGLDEVYLKSMHILDIFSISPRDRFFSPLSWKINTGLDRKMLRDGKEHLIYRINSGGGFSYDFAVAGMWYAMGELDINASPRFSNFLTVGPGFSVGAVRQLTKNIKLHLNFSGYWYPIGDDRFTTSGFGGINFRISQNNSLSLEAITEQTNQRHTSEIALRWNYYY